MRSVIVVFIGSGIGGALRHLVGLASLRLMGPNFPYGTLLVNIIGATLMGLLAGLFAFRVSGQHDLRLFLTTGILGGFTTWSTFSLDVVSLWQRNQPIAAIGYVAVSLIASLAGLAVMLVVMRRLA